VRAAPLSAHYVPNQILHLRSGTALKRCLCWFAQSFNWLYLSRLAALKEFAFMKALQDNGFRVPDAIECNRHAVLMSMVPALPFTQVRPPENRSPNSSRGTMDLVVAPTTR
jgi:RIO-like serine/threonine protein kinase